MFDKFERVVDPQERKRLQCHECKRRTIHLLEAQCKGSWQDEHISGGSEFSILRCGACDAICYQSSSWDSEDYVHDEDGNIHVVAHDVQWPPPSSANFSFNTEYTPTELDQIIEEMLYAFAGGKLVLATVGLRMVVEFIVRDKECPGRKLDKKIDALLEQGHIDDRQRNLLHELRKRGNAGAHEAAGMNTRELVAGMGIVELLLEKFYNGPGRHSELLKRAESVFKERQKT